MDVNLLNYFVFKFFHFFQFLTITNNSLPYFILFPLDTFLGELLNEGHVHFKGSFYTLWNCFPKKHT